MSDAPWGSAPRLMRLDQVGASAPTILGAGQTVAVIDTGIDYTHPSLGGGFGPGKKVVGGYDFVDNDSDPIDTAGHGTQVAGIIAADEFENGGFTYRGVAPAARLVALRIAADTSQVPLNRIESALNWVIANAETFNITVVNLSFGFGRFDTAHTDAVLSNELATLASKDIAFVSAAGNAGTVEGFGITYPGADSNAFAVGSVSTGDVISEFSQRSANLDILAAGESVHTTTLGGAFTSTSGTSFSAPSLAGTFALVRQIDPTFTVDDLTSMLRAANPTNFDGDNETGNTTGRTFQRLDILSTVNIAQQRKAGTQTQQDAVGKAGNENDLAYDSSGVLHFVYYDNDARTMKYATKSVGGQWSAAITIDDAAPNVGTEFSLKLDSYGRPVLAYLDGPNGDLKLAKFNGTAWTREVLDSKGVTGLYPSLAIDGSDRLYIAYYRKTNSDLRMMRNEGSGWIREAVDTNGSVGWSSVLTLDQDQRPAIAYGDETKRQLKLARRNANGTWAISAADTTVRGAAYLSLAFSATNQPAISYYEIDTADLKFASFNGSVWSNARVVSKGATGLYTNLKFQSDGRPRVLYWDRRTDSLQRAVRSGSRWKISRIAAESGKFTTLVQSLVNGTESVATNRNNKLVVQQV